MNNHLTISQPTTLETKRAALLIRRSRLVDSFVQAASAQGKLGRFYREIKRTNEFIGTLDQIAAEMQPKRQSGVPRFVVSSFFLHECFKKLTADNSEQFSFITGVEVDGALVLNQLIELEHDKRTHLGVTANAGFTHRLLIRLEQFGHRLLPIFTAIPAKGQIPPARQELTRAFKSAWRVPATKQLPPSSAGMGLSGSFAWTASSRSKSSGKELSSMKLTFSKSPQSVELRGKRIPGAEDRHRGIPGWDQEKYSKAHVLCIGAGGLISNIAPTLCRKGIGKLTILDDDTVEVSNLNRQRFYEEDVGRNKAIALMENLRRECIFSTDLIGYAVRLEAAIERRLPLECDVAVCGVDNNPARVVACRCFRQKHIPVIFTAVSADGDHGYVFVQEETGPCLGCLFPDVMDDAHFPCPATPAMSDALQAAGAFTVYALDSILTARPRVWNYRAITLSNGLFDGGVCLSVREICHNVH